MKRAVWLAGLMVGICMQQAMAAERAPEPLPKNVSEQIPAGEAATLYGRLQEPIPGAQMSSSFGWRRHPTLRRMRFHAGVDYAAPVVAIQQRLLKMRRFYVIGGMLIGLPWWFLTAPLLVVLTRGAILDQAPSVIWIQLAIGAIGLVATWWFHRLEHRPGREKLGRWLDESAAGGRRT